MRAMAQIVRAVLVAASAAALVQTARAQQPAVGAAAPPITLASWLNVEAGAEPTLDTLKGRIVLLEFWGTWCAPCVRAMPEVQKLHDRYRERGLTVLAISYEAPEVMQPFLQKHGYTMAVGSDPEKEVVRAYGIEGWPTSYVIDREGKIAHVGTPYDAAAAVERALGIETSPATLLTAWLDAQRQDRHVRREAMTRLLEKAPPDFDLRAWARANGGAEAAAAAPAAGSEDATTPAAVAGGAAAVDGTELLRRITAQWNGRDAKKRTELLQRAGEAAPTSFDLAAFVRDAYGKAFPLDRKELDALLEQQKFAGTLDAILDRNPPSSVLSAAAMHPKLAEYCRSQAPEARALAKKGIMVERWVFAGVQPKDNDAFWKELAVSGMATSEDRKQVTGVLLAGSLVERPKIDGFIQRHLSLAIAMDALAASKRPVLDKLAQQVAEERNQLIEQLDQRYRAPEPKK